MHPGDSLNPEVALLFVEIFWQPLLILGLLFWYAPDIERRLIIPLQNRSFPRSVLEYRDAQLAHRGLHPDGSRNPELKAHWPIEAKLFWAMVLGFVAWAVVT